MDNESVAKAIIDLHNDESKKYQMIEYLSSHDYGNESEVDKLYELIASTI